MRNGKEKKGWGSTRKERKNRKRNRRKRNCHQVANNVISLIYEIGLRFIA